MTPVVGWVTPPFEIARDLVEVDDVFEVPLAFLLEPANQQRHFRMIGDVRRDFLGDALWRALYLGCDGGDADDAGPRAARRCPGDGGFGHCPALICPAAVRAPPTSRRTLRAVAKLVGGARRTRSRSSAARRRARSMPRCSPRTPTISVARRGTVAPLVPAGNRRRLSVRHAAAVAHRMRWLASVVGGGAPATDAVSMLDSTPLRRLLRREVDFARIDAHLDTGALHALVINATAIGPGSRWRSARTAGIAAVAARAPPRRARAIGPDHLMASVAIVHLPGRAHRRRVFHGRFGAPDRTAGARAASRRAAPVHLAVGHFFGTALPERQPRSLHLSDVRADRAEPRAVVDLPRQPGRGSRAAVRREPAVARSPGRRPWHARPVPTWAASMRCCSPRRSTSAHARSTTRIACRAACARAARAGRDARKRLDADVLPDVRRRVLPRP